MRKNCKRCGSKSYERERHEGLVGGGQGETYFANILQATFPHTCIEWTVTECFEWGYKGDSTSTIASEGAASEDIAEGIADGIADGVELAWYLRHFPSLCSVAVFSTHVSSTWPCPARMSQCVATQQLSDGVPSPAIFARPVMFPNHDSKSLPEINKSYRVQVLALEHEAILSYFASSTDDTREYSRKEVTVVTCTHTFSSIRYDPFPLVKWLF